MNRIRTSMTIILNSLGVMSRHPKLMVYPLFNILGVIFIAIFFAMPVFFETSIFNAGEEWAAFQEVLQTRGQETRAAREAGNEGIVDHAPVTIGRVTFGGDGFMNLPIVPLAFLYLLSVYVMVFINVAFYSEIMKAFSGEQVRILRGIAFAATRWRAILVWSLMAGIVGLLIRKLEENIGFIGRWVVGLIGFTWSVASVFVIPVIIREQQQTNPVDYLKTSADIIKRSWGEGLAGMIGISGAIILFMIIATVFSIMLMVAMPMAVLFFAIGLFILILVLSLLSSLVKDIFLCGLYVYATEGVVPGDYDQSLMENAWRVKKKKK